ncbi:MAG: hypothetical protein ACRD5R_19005 [Candidatus Acidiferrales bacterium]
MLELDAAAEFDLALEEEFFASIPFRHGVLRIEMTAPGAQPYLARTADLRRAAERLLRPPEANTKRLNLRAVAARIRYRVTGSKFEQRFTLYQQARQDFPRSYRELLRLRPPALLKVNLRNEYPRCYVTRRIRADEAFYLGPFSSRRAADAFAEHFLDLFKIRRCQIKIRRDPQFPGCIYSEMKMCLAPCFAGCTKQEYDAEAGRVLAALASCGASLTQSLEAEREAASQALDFERAAALHKRIEKAADALRALPDLARRIEDLNLVILTRTAEEKTIAVFPMHSGMLAEPVFLRFAEMSSEPRSVEEILRRALQPPARAPFEAAHSTTVVGLASDHDASLPAIEENARARYGLREASPDLPEHLALLARWFYSKPREGEILFRDADWPYRRILRACGRLLASPRSPRAGASSPPQQSS